MTTRMPRSPSAHAACSRLDPQPKLSPAIRIGAPLKSALSNRLSGSARRLSNAPRPMPSRVVVFSQCAGMITSVSTFLSPNGIARPSTWFSGVMRGLPRQRHFDSRGDAETRRKYSVAPAKAGTAIGLAQTCQRPPPSRGRRLSLSASPRLRVNPKKPAPSRHQLPDVGELAGHRRRGRHRRADEATAAPATLTADDLAVGHRGAEVYAGNLV